MSTRLLIVWIGLFISFCLIGAWIYMTSQTDHTVNNVAEPVEASSSQKPLKPITGQIPDEQKIAAPKTQAVIKPDTSDTANNHKKPLNLNLDSTPKTVSGPSSLEGPVKPPPASENTPVGGEDTLPLKGAGPKDKLLYGYEGKDKDDNVNLMLGVQKDDVTIKSGVKKGEDETEVQSIEIEIKLPK